MDKLNKTPAPQITGPRENQTNAQTNARTNASEDGVAYYGGKILELTRLFEKLDCSNGQFHLFSEGVTAIDDDRYLSPTGLYVRARALPSVWKGKSPYPSLFSDKLSCGHCQATHTIGFAAFIRHAVQSHPHEDVFTFQHADVDPKSADETTQEGGSDMLRELGLKLIRTHVKLARTVMTRAALGAIIIHADPTVDPNDYDYEKDTIDRFRVEKLFPKDWAPTPGGTLFASATLEGLKSRDILPHLPEECFFAIRHGLLYLAATLEDLRNVKADDWIPVRSAPRHAPTEATPQSAQEGQGGLIMSGLGAGPAADPASEATVNAAATTTAQAQATGMTVGMEAPGMVGGTTVSSSSAMILRAPGVPPELGLMTGTQWNVVDQALGAYGIVLDGEISNTNYPQGEKVFEIPAFTFPTHTKTYVDQHIYMSGSTEFQVALYGTTNTTGAILVYDEEDLGAPITIARGLARPHFILNASAGKTEVCMMVADSMRTAHVRRTFDPTTDAPRIRAVMYSPLVNTFGTDLSLNLKVLSRPGPDFRVWGPKGGSSASNITEWTLPTVPYLEIDSNRELKLFPKVDPSVMVETPGLTTFEALGQVGIPNTSAVQNVSNVKVASIHTRDSALNQGFLTPFAVTTQTGSGIGFKQLSMFAGSVDAGVVTSNFPCRNQQGYFTDYTSGGPPDPLMVNVPNGTGYTGIPGQSIPNVTNGLVNRFSSGGSYITVKSWTDETGKPGTVDQVIDVNGINSDRDTAVGPGFQPPALSPGYKALFPAFYPAPTIPASVEAAFGALDGGAARWADSLKQLADAGGLSEFDATLWVDGKKLGAVRYSNSSFQVRSALPYLEYPVGGSIQLKDIQPVSTLELPALNFELWDKRQSQTVNVDFRHLEKVRVLLTTLKRLPRIPITAYQKAKVGIARWNLSVQSGLAAIGGGALSGLGSGLGQYAQNAWWTEQFGKNREHESEMAREQQQHEKEMLVAQHRANYLTNWAEQQTRMRNLGLTTPVPRTQVRTDITAAINGAQGNPSRALVPAGNAPRSQVMNAVSRGTQPGSRPTLSLAGATTGSSSTDPKSWRSRAMAKGPAPPPPPYGKAPAPSGPPLGDMTAHATEQYHPASINDGARTTPAAVASAIAPFTEGQKRQ